MNTSSPPGSSVPLATGVSIRESDLRFHFARSGGPGGQNVNKVNTKAELRVHPRALAGLSGPALRRLITAMAPRMTDNGDIRIVSETERSQSANREACLDKLRACVQAAVIEPAVRRMTRPTRGSRERRLESKRARSRIKALRRGLDDG
jgi:ribosome-associated protein